MAKPASFRVSPDPLWLESPLVREWGWNRRRTAGQLGPHHNPGYEITYAAEGEFHWKIEAGPTLSLRSGQVCVMQPQVQHRGQDDLFAPGVLFWLVVVP